MSATFIWQKITLSVLLGAKFVYTSRAVRWFLCNKCFIHPIFCFWFLVTFGDKATKIFHNICLHFARQDGQDGKKQKENHTTKATKIPKTKRQKSWKTKKIRNSLLVILLFFIFILPVLPCKQKTLYRKSRNLFPFWVTVNQNEKRKMGCK